MAYVTKTGRAISPGRTTRASTKVRKRMRQQERPLPFDLQCHPKALSRTPMHPECRTGHPAAGHAARFVRLARESGNTTGFQRGEWLRGTGDWALYVYGEGQHTEYGLFRHDSLDEALGWALAARQFGYDVRVYAARGVR